jgi:hypothetical protein
MSGFTGSIVSRVLTFNSVEAASDVVLRGRRIELVDGTNKARAVLDFDATKRVRFQLLSADYATAIEISVGGAGSPSVIINGVDGGRRIDMHLGVTGKPVLQMGDGESPSKLVLGSIQPDFPDPTIDIWSLEFNKPAPLRPLAGINMNIKHGGQLSRGSVYIFDSGGHRWSLPPTASTDPGR